jgi:hypothetical protein
MVADDDAGGCAARGEAHAISPDASSCSLAMLPMLPMLRSRLETRAGTEELCGACTWLLLSGQYSQSPKVPSMSPAGEPIRPTSTAGSGRGPCHLAEAPFGHPALRSLHASSLSASCLRSLARPLEWHGPRPSQSFDGLQGQAWSRRPALYSVFRYSSNARFSSASSTSAKSWPAALLPGLRVSKYRRRSEGRSGPAGRSGKVSISRPTRTSS